MCYENRYLNIYQGLLKALSLLCHELIHLEDLLLQTLDDCLHIRVIRGFCLFILLLLQLINCMLDLRQSWWHVAFCISWCAFYVVSWALEVAILWCCHAPAALSILLILQDWLESKTTLLRTFLVRESLVGWMRPSAATLLWRSCRKDWKSLCWAISRWSADRCMLLEWTWEPCSHSRLHCWFAWSAGLCSQEWLLDWHWEIFFGWQTYIFHCHIGSWCLDVDERAVWRMLLENRSFESMLVG